MDREYRSDIDAIKGIAIIAVILYHVGMLPYGFLGVDTFLVINGFLIIPSLINQFKHDEFKFFPWFIKRLFRLWPIVIAASLVSLAIGYWLMIPDSYENLAASVVASDLFANNILSAITTKDYWNASNEFKPLMQMWYLGVIVQFYVLYPLIIFICKKTFSKFRNSSNFWTSIVAVIGLVSFLFYVFFPDSYNNKFYFVQYRVWEFSVGGFLGMITYKHRVHNRCTTYMGYLLLCMLFLLEFKSITQVDSITVIGMDVNPSADTLKILLTSITAFVTGYLLLNKVKSGGVLPWLGKMSLSLFVWHQVILSFVRYGFIEKLDLFDLCVYLISTLVVSFLSYKLIEQIKARRRYIKVAIFIVFLLTTSIAFLIYLRAGVVRDVPELGITTDNPYNNRNTEYIDQIYKFDRPFTTDRLHVLVVGNSFARDFACILKEYDTDETLELSYASDFRNIDDVILRNTDYMFVFGPKHKIPDVIFSKIKPTCKTYGIGTKSYGKNFGIFYAKRNSPDYFKQTINSHPIVDSLNAKWKSEWGENNFIDIMEASRLNDGTIRIFTPEHKVISFDCEHLTQDGCKFYAKQLNLNEIFN